MRCVEVNTLRVNRDDCVVMALRVVLVDPSVCLALDGRKRRKSRWHVLVRNHGSDRAELADEQKVCPRKGAQLWALRSG